MNNVITFPQKEKEVPAITDKYQNLSDALYATRFSIGIGSNARMDDWLGVALNYLDDAEVADFIEEDSTLMDCFAINSWITHDLLSSVRWQYLRSHTSVATSFLDVDAAANQLSEAFVAFQYGVGVRMSTHICTFADESDPEIAELETRTKICSPKVTGVTSIVDDNPDYLPAELLLSLIDAFRKASLVCRASLDYHPDVSDLTAILRFRIVVGPKKVQEWILQIPKEYTLLF